jgi:hypothetical protein
MFTIISIIITSQQKINNLDLRPWLHPTINHTVISVQPLSILKLLNIYFGPSPKRKKQSINVIYVPWFMFTLISIIITSQQQINYLDLRPWLHPTINHTVICIQPLSMLNLLHILTVLWLFQQEDSVVSAPGHLSVTIFLSDHLPRLGQYYQVFDKWKGITRLSPWGMQSSQLDNTYMPNSRCFALTNILKISRKNCEK